MNGITQQFEAVQRMMLVPSSAALEDNVRRFWDIQDKLLDAVIKRIEPDGIVFTEQTVSGLGITQSRDVRKALRPSSSEGAR